MFTTEGAAPRSHILQLISRHWLLLSTVPASPTPPRRRLALLYPIHCRYKPAKTHLWAKHRRPSVIMYYNIPGILIRLRGLEPASSTRLHARNIGVRHAADAKCRVKSCSPAAESLNSITEDQMSRIALSARLCVIWVRIKPLTCIENQENYHLSIRYVNECTQWNNASHAQVRFRIFRIGLDHP